MHLKVDLEVSKGNILSINLYYVNIQLKNQDQEFLIQIKTLEDKMQV